MHMSSSRPGPEPAWFDWAPLNDRALLITKTIDGKGRVSIVDLADHTATDLPFDLDVASATWRPNHDQLVVSTNDLAKTDEVITRHFWVVNADGSGTPRPIRVSQYAINEPSLSPDGTKLAYATWEPFVEGRIHVVDIDAGDDHSITTDAQDGYVWLNPQFSPDGTHILVLRFFQSTTRSQVALLPADRRRVGNRHGPDRPRTRLPIHSSHPTGRRSLPSTRPSSRPGCSTPTASNGHEAPFSAIGGAGATWQRRAP